MKKVYCSLLIAASLSASTFTNDKLESWRDGFITAYKAMKVDTEIQGISSKLLDTKDYIIYFDANDKMISDWDKLMVQMFGYSSSIHKPIRTVENFVIFDSYDNEATALQEMEILNEKIFKNSKKYKLKIFDNSVQKRKFFNDRALLIDELKDLETLLKRVNEIKLSQKQKELEENQKVALVYVDNNTNKIIQPETITPAKKEQINSAKDEAAKTSKKKSTSETNKNTFVKEEFYGKPKKESITAFYRPAYDMKYKKDEISQNDILEFESKNGYGWYKVKDKRLYLPGHLIEIVDKPQNNPIKKNNSNLSSIEKKIVSTKEKVVADAPIVNKVVDTEKIKEVKKETIKKLFTLIEKEVVVFQLNDTYKEDKDVYEVKYFDAKGVMQNDYTRIEYSSIVSDTDGNKYIKLKDKNAYIEFKNAYIIK